jgi:hypothetical protein
MNNIVATLVVSAHMDLHALANLNLTWKFSSWYRTIFTEMGVDVIIFI